MLPSKVVLRALAASDAHRSCFADISNTNLDSRLNTAIFGASDEELSDTEMTAIEISKSGIVVPDKVAEDQKVCFISG